MTQKTYHQWDITKKSIVGRGGKKKQYSHYCPKKDFISIVEKLIKIANEKKIFSRLDILKQLEGKKIEGDKKFNADNQKYKINMVLQYLIDRRMIKFYNTLDGKKVGKKANGYILNYKGDKILKEISKLL